MNKDTVILYLYNLMHNEFISVTFKEIEMYLKEMKIDIPEDITIDGLLDIKKQIIKYYGF